MNMDHAKKRKVAPEVFENLKKYFLLVSQANRTALLLLAHPESSANTVMDVQARLVALNRGYNLTYYSVRNEFQNYEPRFWDWGMYRPLI